jgi:type IV secretory pathway component VirB8
VPLSDHEQRLLDEIEQALYADDPKFVSSVRSVRAPSRRRRTVFQGVLGVILGLVLVLVGLVASLVPLSVFGFVLVVAACAFIVQRFHAPPADASAAVRTIAAGSARRGSRPSGLRARMEARLHRRFDET